MKSRLRQRSPFARPSNCCLMGGCARHSTAAQQKQGACRKRWVKDVPACDVGRQDEAAETPEKLVAAFAPLLEGAAELRSFCASFLCSGIRSHSFEARPVARLAADLFDRARKRNGAHWQCRGHKCELGNPGYCRPSLCLRVASGFEQHGGKEGASLAGARDGRGDLCANKLRANTLGMMGDPALLGSTEVSRRGSIDVGARRGDATWAKAAMCCVIRQRSTCT